jgi:thiamine-phosphate pyrophosphorylase
MRLRGFYFITDRKLSLNGIIEDARQAVKGGACVVQYRDKLASSREMLENALKLKKLCRRIPLIVNDRVDIALASGADGVHLGQDDLPCALARKLLGRKKIIGVTVGSLKEAREALIAGADYLGVAPVFATSTKPDAGRAVGLKTVREIRKAVPLPLVAIGGITLENAPQAFAAGAQSVAALSGLLRRRDIAGRVRIFSGLSSPGAML